MGNPYPVGQCTWYCADLEPWVLTFGNLGNALSWASAWQIAGGPVSMTPLVHSIACFQPGDDGALPPDGHVAVVESFTAIDFTVTEMHAPKLGVVDTRVCGLGSGVRFLVPLSVPTSGDELTPEQAAQLTELQAQVALIFAAIFEPTEVGGPTPGFTNYAPGNNIDIIRRKVSPYNEGYPPSTVASPPEA